MAIQTRGFGVDVMPVAAPLSVPNVAFNPEAVNEGILSAYKVANEAEKFQAFKLLNDEVNQLRQDRIAAGHANLQNQTGAALAAIQLRPQKTANEGFSDQSLAMLNPGVRKLALAEQGSTIVQQPQKLAMAEAQTAQDAAIQGDKLVAQADTAARQAAEASAGLDTVDTEIATKRANAEVARGTAEQAAATLADRQQIELVKLQSDLANAKTDVDVARAAAALRNKLVEAQINQADATAKFQLGQGRQTAVGRDKTVQDIAAFTRMEGDYLKRAYTVDGNPTSLEVYAAQLAEDPSAPHNAEADAALIELDHIREMKRDVIREDMAAKAAKRQAQIPPVEVKYQAQVPPVQSDSQGVYDTPALATAPAATTPEIRYDRAGNAFTLDANGNVVPYKP